jgi:hypothetical protein
MAFLAPLLGSTAGQAAVGMAAQPSQPIQKPALAQTNPPTPVVGSPLAQVGFQAPAAPQGPPGDWSKFLEELMKNKVA